MQSRGNFQDEATRKYTGDNVLYRSGAVIDDARLEDARQKLFAHRKTRIHPLKDDKVLADWNGLIDRGHGRARDAYCAKRPMWKQRSVRAAFVETRLMRGGSRLLHRWRDGVAAVPALLDDYAFMAWGLD